jgi:uncharacterized protein
MDPVVHFEMPAINKERVRKFYEAAFGWQMKQLGADIGDYILATTSPVDEHNMHKNKGAINGGFYEMGKSGIMPHVVIAVKDISKSMELVKKADGEIMGEPVNIRGIGEFVMFKDTEGNSVGMLQPTMNK